MRAKSRQLELSTWGGRREGTGRKRPPRSKVSHRQRPEHTARYPLHVVLRIALGIPSLRSPIMFAAVRAAIEAGCSRFGSRVVHFSVQANHIHLIVEACNALSLTRGMQGLMVRIARAVNRTAAGSGRVFDDHSFARELRTPAEVRRAVRYVLDNAMLHAGESPRTDTCASSAPLVAPRTWLLAVGWLRSRAGPLPVSAWSGFEDGRGRGDLPTSERPPAEAVCFSGPASSQQMPLLGCVEARRLA
jgi:putative transposase